MSTRSKQPHAEKPSSDGREISESKEQLLDDYRWMVRMRAFEDQSVRAFRSGLAGGYLHVYTGMEATAIGWLSSRQPDDPIITAYRDHAHALYLGIDPVVCMAEIMGRAKGTSKGKGGSMHLYSADHHFYGGWGIVGGHTALGAGLGFAIKYKGGNQVAHCFLGDGAANAGVFFEVMNMASLWDLPVIFIIENNEFAMGTRLEFHAADPEMHKRAEGFNMHHERIDGMDVIDVRRDAQRIISNVRETSRPALIEVMNYRYAGHGAADNDQTLYRSQQEVELAWKRDPVHRLANLLTEQYGVNKQILEKIQREAEEEMEGVYDEAAASPKPEPDEVYSDVYTDMQPERGH